MSEEKDPRSADMRDSLLGSLRWRLIGPHRGGRVVAVAGDVSDPMTFYFGACAGGVWKTTDGGTYWHNVSDGYFNTAAVGALAVSQSDPNVIYAGMGESSIRGNVVHGDGVYKSTDAGRTWRHMGLTDTRHIGKIQIHPENPDLVYVAAFGHAWGPNEERGVYRSQDGGETWEKVLYKSERAGSHDVSMDPNNPRILYAAIWQAQRYPHALISGGEECGIWRSFDAGDTWQEITRNHGLPQGMLGKIGIVASPARSGRVWALVEAEDGAVFRSDDFGETWTRLSEQALLRTRPWYYMHITADPQDADTVYVQNYSFWKSIDGGASFNRIPTPHGDDHALWIDPNNPQRMIEGNDGGACVSFNGGKSWSSIYNQPTAQLYHVTTDDRFPYRVYGSQQDNTAISIPSASVDGAIHERDWYAPGGGESGYIAIKPDDPNIVIASGPAGRRAYNDIMTHYDHRTGQKWNVTVWPELYGWGVGAGDLKYRLQWTFPIMFSRHDPDVLYVAGNHLFRSTDLGASFETISADLTRNNPSTLQASGGPVTRDNTGAEVYGTIFALAESQQQPGVLWAGSDDGLVHTSEDGGRNWQAVTVGDLPEWSLISIIETSPHDEGTVYIAATRYKHDDTRPYLYKTTDHGAAWTKITDGIPEDDFTRVIREDPAQPGLLYAGTESGIYVSFDGGENWQRAGGNLPLAPVHDFVVKDSALVVATHGRSFWILDDLSPLREIAAGLNGAGMHLFGPAPKVRMRQYGRVWGSEPGTTNYGQASTSVFAVLPEREADGSIKRTLLDAGENPPEGMVIQYYFSDEPEGEVSLRVLDAEGREVRAFSSQGRSENQDVTDPGRGAVEIPARAGVNRFHWDLRYPGYPNVVGEGLAPWDRHDGPLVLPSTYTIELTANGETVTENVEVLPDPRVAAGIEDLRQQQGMLFEIGDAIARCVNLLNSLTALRGQLVSLKSREDAGAMHRQVVAALDVLDTTRGKLIDLNMAGAQLYASGIHEKLNALFDSVDSADYAPPRQAREVLVELSAQLQQHEERAATDLKDRLVALNEAMGSAGIAVVGPMP